MGAHHAWLERGGAAPSPIAEFARRHGLRDASASGSLAEWPGGGAPGVVQVGRQVVVHAEGSFALPSTLGEYVYAVGGRVCADRSDTAARLVWHLQLWVPYTRRKKPDLTSLEAVQRALAEGELPVLDGDSETPALELEREDDALDLRLWVALADVVGGLRHIAGLVERHGVYVELDVTAAVRAHGDALAGVRTAAPVDATEDTGEMPTAGPDGRRPVPCEPAPRGAVTGLTPAPQDEPVADRDALERNGRT